ncbi:hypothetical protein FCU42_15600 [Vibrio parahaemolyticus]|uniref:DUF7019 family protein n=1 Tax=Vibrio parahaemolyticus TaxID=670 RepID=UPI001594BC5B|nr:SAVMC3_10250 family protein [Vibrio parahaemolyticus]NVC28581.1 hypothetical protein [Vibrio parahaemolyticus]
MRYYLYISEPKVDMLYSQIPAKMLDNIAGKLTIDLKLIKTEFSESPQEKTLHAKILMIEEYLQQCNFVGSTSAPNKYILDSSSMKMASYPSGLVYFGAENGAIVGLGGSATNVLGDRSEGRAHSHSVTPILVQALKDEFENVVAENCESSALAGVELATSQMTGVKQKMSFLAKTLLKHPSDSFEYSWHGQSGDPVILGSPVYVALDE